MLNHEAVIELLRGVKYPGYSRDIVSFGLVKDVSISGASVTVRLQLSAGSPTLAQQLREACEAALRKDSRVHEAHAVVDIPTPGTAGAPNPWANQSRVPGIRHLVAIASGKGGVGKSTVSVNLACALVQLGAKVGLLDCDIYGPSIPLMMGTRDRPTLSEQEKMVPPVRHGVKLMSMGFLIEGDAPVIWRGPMIMKTVQQFLLQVEWGELDFLLVDLPPGTGDAQLSLCQTAPIDGGVVVTTPQEASLGVVRKGIAMFEKVNVPILGIVENMSYFTTPTGERVEIFGHGGGRAEADRQKIPFLGEVPIFTAIREGGDKGIPVTVSDPGGPAAQAFLAVAESLRARLGSPRVAAHA